MSKRHKHAGLIHEWAEGAEIQVRSAGSEEWRDDLYPCFFPNNEYRIKPRTVKREGWAVIYRYCVGDTHMVERIYGSEDDAKKDYPYATSVIKIEWLEDV